MGKLLKRQKTAGVRASRTLVAVQTMGVRMHVRRAALTSRPLLLAQKDSP